MKKLFLCMLALSTGAFAFVSCDKEKDNVDDASKDRQKYENVLSYERQQDILSNALTSVVQVIDFTSLSQTLQSIMAEFGDNTIDINDMFEAIAQQDEILGGRINAIREFLYTEEDILFDFEGLFFEANLDFVLDTIPFPDGAGGVIDSVMIIPYVSDVIYESDQFKLNIGFNNKEERAVIVLKGHNDPESRVSITNATTQQVKNITLPDTLDLSVTIGNNTVLAANFGYETDFQVQVEGTGSIIRKEVEGVKPDKFKLTKLILNGEELSLNAGVKLDKYAILAGVDYDKENGVNITAKAQMLGADILSIRAKIDATLSENLDWKNPMGSILPWLTINTDRMARGGQIEAVLGNDDIKLLASFDLTDNEIVTALMALVLGQPKTQEEFEKASQQVEYLNNRIKGELYFKGYADPQAKIKFIFDPESVGEKNISKLDDMDAMRENINNSGIRVMIDTYDSNGYAVTVSFQEYFGAIDIKTIGKTIISKFKTAFGFVHNTETIQLSDGYLYYNEDINHGGGRIDDIANGK